ncbi:MAG: FHA domain-containing protein [Candidatus Latescibacteria bacterium]|nr:FHA domain-containing protein [Candidatus Latescibacterota bacterium]
MEENWVITLSFLESPDKSLIGKQKSFSKSPISLGRAENNDMIVTDPAVSRNHAILRITSDFTRVFITDMSTHGTEVSGKVVPKGRGSGFTLENGDAIKIGNTILQYELKLKSSVQSTMIGTMDRSFLEKAPEVPIEVEEEKEIVDTHKRSAPSFKKENQFSPLYIGIIIICIIILLFLLFGSYFFE